MGSSQRSSRTRNILHAQRKGGKEGGQQGAVKVTVMWVEKKDARKPGYSFCTKKGGGRLIRLSRGRGKKSAAVD